jgi:hypothetical protein
LVEAIVFTCAVHHTVTVQLRFHAFIACKLCCVQPSALRANGAQLLGEASGAISADALHDLMKMFAV